MMILNRMKTRIEMMILNRMNDKLNANKDDALNANKK